MKFSTCMAVFAVTLAVATCGCRYNKVNGGAGDGSETDLATSGVDVGTETDIATSDEALAIGGGNLSDLASGSFKDRGSTQCTDVSFAPVYFRFDATKIEESELAKVEAVARHLADNPDRVVTIEGNCDERGSNEYNLSLGDDRAIIISNYLASNGIARNRMETVSRGETNPAVEGHGESAWSQNRRGEFIIWKK